MEGLFYMALTAVALVLCLELTATAAATATPSEFIRFSCKVTQYPDLCEKSLSSYASAMRRRSPRLLAHAAVSVTAQRAVAASRFVHRMSAVGRGSAARGPRGGGAVRDCVETVGDGAERLQRSAMEMVRMGRFGSRSFKWKLSNVQTWVSAALTDESTCIDSLSQDKSAAAVRQLIVRQIVHIRRLTSNALALVNRLDPNDN